MLIGKAWLDKNGTTHVEIKGHTDEFICSAISTLIQTYYALGGECDEHETGKMHVRIPPVEVEPDLYEYGKFMLTGILLVRDDERSKGKFEFEVVKEAA